MLASSSKAGNSKDMDSSSLQISRIIPGPGTRTVTPRLHPTQLIIILRHPLLLLHLLPPPPIKMAAVRRPNRTDRLRRKLPDPRTGAAPVQTIITIRRHSRTQTTVPIQTYLNRNRWPASDVKIKKASATTRCPSAAPVRRRTRSVCGRARGRGSERGRR